MIEFLDPEGLYRSPSGSFHQVAKSGQLAYISGQTAQDANGEVVGAGDAEAQAEQIMRNLNVCLAALGLDYRSVIKTTVYHTERSSIDIFRTVRRRTWPDYGAASTSLLIQGLDNPAYLMEVEAIVDIG